MNSSPIRIATRASRLALWQAEYVKEGLLRIHPTRDVELIHISTEGDRDQTEPLHLIGSLGVFTREVQRAVLDGRADLAVHSLKDLPTEPVAGLSLAAIPPRASMFDALILPADGERPDGTGNGDDESPLDCLPNSARVATGSIRRRSQLLHWRPDLEMCGIRGNVETRIRKLDEGQFDALILAEAALNRLELDARISRVLRPPVLYPAVSQGALGIECRSDDAPTAALLGELTDPATHSAAIAERTLLAELRAGCHAPVGVLSRVDADAQSLEAVVLSTDGRRRIVVSVSGSPADPVALGKQAASELGVQGAQDLIEAADG